VNVGGQLLPLVFLILYFPKLCILLRHTSAVHIITRVTLAADARMLARPSPFLPLNHHPLSLSCPFPSSSRLIFYFLSILLVQQCVWGSDIRSPAGSGANAFLTNLTTENTSGDNRFGERSTWPKQLNLLFSITKLTCSNSLSSSLFFRSFSLTSNIPQIILISVQFIPVPSSQVCRLTIINPTAHTNHVHHAF